MNKNVSPKIAFIYNPAAGKGAAITYYQLLKNLLGQRWELALFSTDKGKVIELTASVCRQGFNRLIIAGGDGTIMEAVNGIIISRQRPVLAIIPQGTGNDLARALGYQRRFKKSYVKYLKGLAGEMENPSPRFCPILCLNNQLYFLSYLGIGFDAMVVKEFSKKRFLPLPNRLIYLFSIIKNLFWRSDQRVTISIVGRERQNTIKDFKNILLINIPSYAGGLMRPKGINIETDYFQLIIIKRIWDFLFIDSRASSLSLNLIFGKKEPEIYRVDQVKLSFAEEVCLQIDGEDYTEQMGDKRILEIKKGGWLQIFK